MIGTTNFSIPNDPRPFPCDEAPHEVIDTVSSVAIQVLSSVEEVIAPVQRNSLETKLAHLFNSWTQNTYSEETCIDAFEKITGMHFSARVKKIQLDVDLVIHLLEKNYLEILYYLLVKLSKAPDFLEKLILNFDFTAAKPKSVFRDSKSDDFFSTILSLTVEDNDLDINDIYRMLKKHDKIELIVNNFTMFPLLRDPEKRIQIAFILLKKNPHLLANHLLALLDKNELVEDERLSTIIQDCLSLCTDEKTIDYLTKTQLYVDKLKLIHRSKSDDASNSLPAPACSSSSSAAPTLEPSESSFLAELENKTEGYWDCIGKETDTHGHTSWIFKLKRKFDPDTVSPNKFTTYRTDCIKTEFKIENEDSRLFPALHTRGGDILKDPRGILSKLGYKFQSGPSGTFITLPDKEALMARWEQIRQTPYGKKLPGISIAGSAGIATASQFNELFSFYDGILSDGKEFVHDHLLHLIRTFILIRMSPEAYVNLRNQEISLHNNILELLKNAKANFKTENERKIIDMLTIAEAIHTDIMTNESEFLGREDMLRRAQEPSRLIVLCESLKWNRTFRNELGDLSDISNTDIRTIWNAIHVSIAPSA